MPSATFLGAASRTVGALVVGLFALGSASAQPYSVVHDFTLDPGYPRAGLVEAGDGRIYGTTAESVYVLTPDGLGGFDYSMLHKLTASEGLGASSLILASDGEFYGTTASGGANDMGTVFRIDAAGQFTSVHSFSGADGSEAGAALVQGSDGAFYGTTFRGGDEDAGTFFRIDASGGTLATLHSFSLASGGNPASALILSGGDFYGTTNAPATIFRITSAGDLTTLHTLGSGEGQPSELVEASDGLFYGTTSSILGFAEAFHIDTMGNFAAFYTFPPDSHPYSLIEGSDGKLYGGTGGDPLGSTYGSVYRLTAGGAVEFLHTFQGSDGRGAGGKLLEASDGMFYGASGSGGVGVSGTTFRVDIDGNFDLLHDFGQSLGEIPSNPLVQASDGYLYGLTTWGGENGVGTAFRLDLAGGFSLLHSFTSAEACQPTSSGFVEGAGGDLFAAATCGGDFLWGSFFKMDPSGSVTVLRSFDQDGDGPQALMRASDGYFYGATIPTSPGPRIARLDSSGGLTYPFTFPGNWDPGLLLVEGADGALYGTTGAGGASSIGTVFRVETSGNYSELHAFSGGDGSVPVGLTLASDGWFYGTTLYGGIRDYGTVFRIDPAGAFQPLYAFGANTSGDGVGPSRLTDGHDGYLYGSTAYGGSADLGTVFRIDALGRQSVIHSFRGGLEGEAPEGGLVLATDGMLYGTSFGGASGRGVVYRVDPASALSVLTLEPGSGPSSGGTLVSLTGAGFEPGASVTFGMTPANGISVPSGAEITATTPGMDPGALYHVAVSNPGGAEGSLAKAWFADFLDVSQSDIFHAACEKILRNGVTAGCGNGLYCRNASVTRAQMAVFLLKGRYGYFYTPPPPTGSAFADVAIDAFAAAWIEDLAARGIAAGCGGGNYCPGDPVTRAQMAVFLLKTLLGPAYAPPSASGTLFDDVASSDFAADFIEDLAGRGITAGCSITPPLYCPGSANTRGQMAVFLVSTFGLP